MPQTMFMRSPDGVVSEVVVSSFERVWRDRGYSAYNPIAEAPVEQGDADSTPPGESGETPPVVVSPLQRLGRTPGDQSGGSEQTGAEE